LLTTCSSNGSCSTKCRCMTMRTPQSLRGGTIVASNTRGLPSDIKNLQAESKSITIKQMPHPVHIMPGIISFFSHLSVTESVDVIKRDQAHVAWQQTRSPVHRRSNNGLFECAILGIGKRFLHHRA